MKNCYECKITESEEWFDYFIEVDGPNSGCSEFAIPEQHPINICSKCQELADNMDNEALNHY